MVHDSQRDQYKMETSSAASFKRNYDLHLQHLKLKGLQDKTIDAYARAIWRQGGFLVAHAEACAAARLSAGATFWVLAPQQQKPDRLAADAIEVHSRLP